MIAVSFSFFLLGFLLVGLWSARQSRGTRRDYYLASSSVPPWLVGLSAVATNNSGYMFIGVIGYTYATGLAAIWLMVGWITGDFIASMLIHKQLRRATERTGEVSFAGVLANWHGGRMLAVQRIGALVSLVFLLAYAAAQLVAGSKALHALLDWPLWSGAVAGAVMVALYCFAGGIRASIWTDAAQSVVMIVAMGLLLFVAVGALGGLGGAVSAMEQVPGFLSWYPDDLVFPGVAGGVLYAASWMFAGFSVVGQPHVMVRFMTLNNPRHFIHARAWYYLWFILFYSCATAVGMLSRVYLSADNFDAELALPMMALELLPLALVGLILAGIFAATMSTADSLILSCSSALTHDLLPGRIERTRWLKLATLFMTILALGLALSNNQSVFSLVIFAWSALASTFAPLMFVYALGGRPGQALVLAMMTVGLCVAIGWRLMGWHEAVYEGMPGILAGLLVYALARAAQGLRSEPVGVPRTE